MSSNQSNIEVKENLQNFHFERREKLSPIEYCQKKIEEIKFEKVLNNLCQIFEKLKVK